jgi:quinol monooxygenase YgiN
MLVGTPKKARKIRLDPSTNIQSAKENKGMGYVLAVTWVARPGEEEAIAGVLREMVPATQAEPGCIHYYAHRSLDDPRRFFLFEEYVDEAALQAHMDSEHFQRHVIGEAVPRLESRERLGYRPL